jgi:hypothetical protein
VPPWALGEGEREGASLGGGWGMAGEAYDGYAAGVVEDGGYIVGSG